MKFGDYSGHHVQYLGVSRIGDVAVVIHQHRIQKWWNDISVDHLMVIRPLNVIIDQLQDLFFDGPKAADFGHLCRDQPWPDISHFHCGFL